MNKLCVCSVLLLTLSTGAWAESPDGDTGAVSMTLPEKQVYVQAFLPVNLSTDLAFEPVSLAPDLWYGLSDKLSLGLTHSRPASDGFFGGPGAGICFVGEDKGCPQAVQNTALQVRYALPASLPLAVDGGLVFRSYDPFTIALKLGVVGRWQRAALSVLFGANLFVGMNERDAGNKEILDIPITAMYALNGKASVGLQTGVGIPFENTGDLYFIPVAVGGRYMVTPRAHADLVFSLPLLISGQDGVNGFDTRVLTLGGGYAF